MLSTRLDKGWMTISLNNSYDISIPTPLFSALQIATGLFCTATTDNMTKGIIGLSLTGSGVSSALYTLTTNPNDYNTRKHCAESLSGAVIQTINGVVNQSTSKMSAGPRIACNMIGGVFAEAMGKLTYYAIYREVEYKTEDFVRAAVSSGVRTVAGDTASKMTSSLLKNGTENIVSNMIISGAVHTVAGAAAGVAIETVLTDENTKDRNGKMLKGIVKEAVYGLGAGGIAGCRAGLFNTAQSIPVVTPTTNPDSGSPVNGM